MPDGCEYSGPSVRTESASTWRLVRDVLLLGLLLLTFAVIGVGYMYVTARSAQIEAVRQELTQLSVVAAAQVDGDLHRRIKSPSQAGSPEHLEVIAPLLRFHRNAAGLIYVYTAVLRDDQIHFVLGTDQIDPSPDAVPDPIMTRYQGSDADFFSALRTQRQITNATPVRERKRSYLSAYAPFFDRQQRFVGVVGIDMWVDKLDQRLLAIDQAALVAGLALACMALASVAWMYRAGLSRLQARRSELQAMALARQQAEEARRSASAASAASRAKSEFLAVMSHELRTPLHGVIGMLEMLKTSTLDAMQQRCVKVMDDSTRSLERVISSVLDLTRIEAGKLQIERGPLQLREISERVINILQYHASHKGLVLRSEFDPAVPDTVSGDAGRITQVLLNLVGNAVKFTPAGEVVIELLVLADQRIRFEVRDTGPGIDEDLRPLLFQAFSQGDSSAQRTQEGSGVGLAISQNLVELMGGRIVFENQPGGGCRFSFDLLLPALPEEPPADRQVQ